MGRWVEGGQPLRTTATKSCAHLYCVTPVYGDVLLFGPLRRLTFPGTLLSTGTVSMSAHSRKGWPGARARRLPARTLIHTASN